MTTTPPVHQVQPDESVSERPVIKTAKKQAKRLLRLAHNGQLNVSALSDALGVMARLNGYPDWNTFARSSGHPVAPSQPPAPVVVNIMTRSPGDNHEDLSSLDTPVFPDFSKVEWVCPAEAKSEHVDQLSSVIHTLNQIGCSNIITPSFEGLRSASKNSDALFVDVPTLLSTNLLLSPLGFQAMLPIHASMLARILVSVLKEEDRRRLISPVLFCIQKSFERRNQFNEPVLLTDYPDWNVSEQSKERIRQHGAKTFYEATTILLQHGDLDQAWKCHIHAMPTLTDVYLSVSIYQKQLTLECGVSSDQIEKLQVLFDFWVGVVGTQKTWNIPKTGVAIFQVDPIFTHRLDPHTRWLMAALAATLRRMDTMTARFVKDLQYDAYCDNAQTQWLLNIDPIIKEQLLAYYGANQKLSSLDQGTDIYDDMIGPQRSSAIIDTVSILMREHRKWGVGVWVVSPHVLADQTMQVFVGPKTQLKA